MGLFVKHPKVKREIKIRPLSDGIGLGNLRSPGAQAHQSFGASTAQNSSRDFLDARRAHAAYHANSVATQIRKRKSTVWFVQFWRFVAGLGLDLFVGSFTLLVFAWSGILAWNLGSRGELHPVVSLLAITDTLEKLSFMKLLVAFATAAIFWRATRLAFLRPRVA